MAGGKGDGNAAKEPAPAAAPAADANAKPASQEQAVIGGARRAIVGTFIFLCAFGLAFIALVALDIYPGSLARPYIFMSPHALTKTNWDDKTIGRTVFLKFYAPWCGHCKKLAPAWDQLMAENANHSFLQVGEVECTSTGKTLCEELGVQGYPTLKYGDPNNLQDYTGGRTFEDMSKFASELQPTCGPGHLQACTDKEKKMIEEFQAMGEEGRAVKIAQQEMEIERLQNEFKEFVGGLSSKYSQATEEKDAAVKAVKDGGLSTLKAIQSHEAVKAKSQETTNEEAKDEL